MKISTRIFFAALVMALILAAVALPAAAHAFGPVFYCDAGTLNNCTDTVDVASAEGTERDSYLCGPAPGEQKQGEHNY